MQNKFSGIRIGFHILQSFPVSCLNRDDVGSPKSALIGGIPRARVSSQCWKRAVRLALHDLGIQIAERTKLVKAKIMEQCRMLDQNTSEEIVSEACDQAVKNITGEEKNAKNANEEDSKTLFFISNAEASLIARKLIEDSYKCPDAKTLIKLLNGRKFSSDLDGLDIALFGRMVASFPELNTEAAASFAHAISTHKVTPELDFFTAVDDRKSQDDSGAGHMGLLEYNSATYYRYVSLDLGQLSFNLRTESIQDAVTAFMKALFIAVPAARQKTMAATCPWNYAIVTLRKGQGIQMPFMAAVKPENGKDIVECSKERLRKSFEDTQKMYGSLFGLLEKLEISTQEGDIDSLCEKMVNKISTL